MGWPLAMVIIVLTFAVWHIIDSCLERRAESKQFDREEERNG